MECPWVRLQDNRVQPKSPIHENQDLTGSHGDFSTTVRVLLLRNKEQAGPNEEEGRPYLTKVSDLPLHILVWCSLGLHFGLHDRQQFLQALRLSEGLGGGQSEL